MALAFGPIHPVAYGPLGGAGNQILVFDTGQVGASLVSLSCSITGAGVTGNPGSAWGAICDWVGPDNGTISSTTLATQHFNTSNSATLAGSAPSAATRAVIYFQAALDGSDTAAAYFSGSFVTRDYCEYGTQIGSSWPAIVQLTPTLVNGAIAFRATGPAGILAQFVIGDMLDIVALCSEQRPAPVTWEIDDLRALNVAMDPVALQRAGLKLRQWVKWLMWPTFCECTPGAPGAPPPLSPPDVIIPLPPGMEDDPSLPVLCDNEDVCAMLNQISFRLASVALQLSTLRSDVTLIQRQEVPFAYVPGAVYPGLSGNGVLSVFGLLGISVNITAAPSYLGSDMDPTARSTYYFGWLNLGTADGWLRKIKLTHDPHLLLDVEPAITSIEYQFHTGVVATLTTLVREP